MSNVGRSTPTLVNDGTISNVEFVIRLVKCVENYVEYCKIMKVDKTSAPMIEWLDHWNEFLDLAELDRAGERETERK